MRSVLLLLVFLLSAADAPSPWDIEGLAGKTAPDFSLENMSGKTVTLSSLKGRVVLINFWATWCPPCRDEMPSLNKLYKEYSNNGLVVLAVATDRSAPDVKNFLKKYPVDFEVMKDPDIKTSKRYGVFSLPTTFLVDRNGKVLKTYIGEEQWNSPEIKNGIRKALSTPR